MTTLSPTCGGCAHGAEAVKAAILSPRAPIEVFVVWTPMLGGDDAASARARSEALTGPQVRQYWDPERRVGASFRKDVFPKAVERMRRSLPKGHFFAEHLSERDEAEPEWDIYLFFAADEEWGDRAPTPVHWVRQVARFADGDTGQLMSLMWMDSYASAPVEGDLTEQLRRLAPPAAARRRVH